MSSNIPKTESPQASEQKEPEQLDNKTLRKIETSPTTESFVTKKEETTNLRFYPDKPTQRIHKDRFLVKEPSRYYDPCEESSKMAVRCMEMHDETYKEICGEYFRAYRECKKEWMNQRKKDGSIW